MRCNWSGWCRADLNYEILSRILGVISALWFYIVLHLKFMANSKSLSMIHLVYINQPSDVACLFPNPLINVQIPAPSVLQELHETLHPSTCRIKHNPHCPKNCFLSMSLLKQPLKSFMDDLISNKDCSTRARRSAMSFRRWKNCAYVDNVDVRHTCLGLTNKIATIFTCQLKSFDCWFGFWLILIRCDNASSVRWEQEKGTSDGSFYNAHCSCHLWPVRSWTVRTCSSSSAVL